MVVNNSNAITSQTRFSKKTHNYYSNKYIDVVIEVYWVLCDVINTRLAAENTQSITSLFFLSSMYI